MFFALLSWWRDLIQLNLGNSLVSGEPVLHELAHELGNTLQLAGVALLLSALIGVPLGMLAGSRPGGVIDRGTLALAVLLRALPPFVLGLVLIVVFAVQVSALPAAGHGAPSHIVLPALTLASPLAALSCRVARDAMVSVGQSAYFAFALTKGLSQRQALLRHGLRNVGVPVVAYLGVQMVVLVEGVVIVETLFAWPGIGHALVHAIFGRDVPMIQGTALAMGLLFVLFNALIDVACHTIDPRRKATR
jgi:peptide/nickel transport system permease protein